MRYSVDMSKGKRVPKEVVAAARAQAAKYRKLAAKASEEWAAAEVAQRESPSEAAKRHSNITYRVWSWFTSAATDVGCLAVAEGRELPLERGLAVEELEWVAQGEDGDAKVELEAIAEVRRRIRATPDPRAEELADARRAAGAHTRGAGLARKAATEAAAEADAAEEAAEVARARVVALERDIR